MRNKEKKKKLDARKFYLRLGCIVRLNSGDLQPTRTHQTLLHDKIFNGRSARAKNMSVGTAGDFGLVDGGIGVRVLHFQERAVSLSDAIDVEMVTTSNRFQSESSVSKKKKIMRRVTYANLLISHFLFSSAISGTTSSWISTVDSDIVPSGFLMLSRGATNKTLSIPFTKTAQLEKVLSSAFQTLTVSFPGIGHALPFQISKLYPGRSTNLLAYRTSTYRENHLFESEGV